MDDGDKNNPDENSDPSWEKTRKSEDSKHLGDTIPADGGDTVPDDPKGPSPTTNDEDLPSILREPSFEETGGDPAPSVGEPSTSGSIRVPPAVLAVWKDQKRRLNHYVLVEKVGSGGMGSVWKAWDTKLARWVAVKFLHVDDEESIRRFEREAQLSAQLRHPNIAGVHEVNADGDRHYLVMEFVDGRSARKVELPLLDALRMFVKVCSAIDYAHKREIIHRDIKPANIMLANDGEPSVTDFGLAKVLQTESSLSATGAPLGTPVYMAPEQALGDLKAMDAKSDIYSLGATLYVLVTLKLPFDGESMMAVLHQVTTKDPTPPCEANPDVPSEIDAVIRKAMQKKKEERFETAGEMQRAIESYLNTVAEAERAAARAREPAPEKDIEVSPVTDPTKVPARDPEMTIGTAGRTKKSQARLALLGAAVLVVLIVLLIVRPWQSTGGEKGKNGGRGTEGEWTKDFSRMRARLSFSKFQKSSRAMIADSREELARMPESQRGAWVSWLKRQVDGLPEKAWPKSEWLEKKAAAKKIHDWCQTMRSILKGRKGGFESYRKRLEKIAAAFLPVTVYQGTIRLKIYVSDYGELYSLRIGEDRWVVREGKVVPGEAEIVGSSLHTPLAIRDLDIGDLSLTLTQPGGGRQEFEISASKLRHGKSYIFGGGWDDPDSIRLKTLP